MTIIIKAADADGNIINDSDLTIKISDSVIKAPTNSTTPSTSPVSIQLSVKKKELFDRFKNIVLTANAETSNAIEPLQGKQYVQFKDMVLVVKNGLNLNMNNK